MPELWQLNLAQAEEGLQNKKFSASEMVAACLARIRETEPKISACLSIMEEEAISRAKTLDNMGPDPEKPLWGIPLTVKDLFSIKGQTTTAGSKILSDFKPAFEATVIRRLLDAGAIIVAKTNLDEFAMGSSTEFSAFGPTRNPWNPERVPGGSSGGAAASIAACQTPGAFGTDTGGSIRQPAGLCGCVGLKPTYGRISRYGIIAYASSLDQAGPLARTVTDCGLLLNAVAGPDGQDSTLSDISLPDFVNTPTMSLKGLKLSLPRELWSSLSEPVAKVLEEAKQNLIKAGAILTETDLPLLRYAVATYYILAAAEASTNLARYDGLRFGQRCQNPVDLTDLYTRSRSLGLGTEVKRRIMLGTFVLSSGYYEAYYKKAAQVRRLIQAELNKNLSNHDFILAPVSAVPAWPFGSFIEDPLTAYQMDLMTLPLNLAGGPGLTLSAGQDSQGLPVGIQLWNKPFGETQLLAAGKLLEKVLPPLSCPL